jgi:hypothetical protein
LFFDFYPGVGPFQPHLFIYSARRIFGISIKANPQKLVNHPTDLSNLTGFRQRFGVRFWSSLTLK